MHVDSFKRARWRVILPLAGFSGWVMRKNMQKIYFFKSDEKLIIKVLWGANWCTFLHDGKLWTKGSQHSLWRIYINNFLVTEAELNFLLIISIKFSDRKTKRTTSSGNFPTHNRIFCNTVTYSSHHRKSYY